MFIKLVLIYSKLSFNQRQQITKFIKSNFNNNTDNLAFDDKIIIILKLINKKIIGLLCLLHVINFKLLLKKMNTNYLPYYNDTNKIFLTVCILYKNNIYKKLIFKCIIYMFVKLIYSKLSFNQQQQITKFIKSNFNNNTDNLAFDDKTIIILKLINKKIIGVICLLHEINFKLLLKKINMNYSPYYINDDTNKIYLYNFCIDTKYRNKQIGTELVNYTINLIKKLNVNYIFCYIENSISKHIFLKNNFINKENTLIYYKNILR